MRHPVLGLRARRAAVAFAFLAPSASAQVTATLSVSPPGAGISLAYGTHFEDHMGVAVSGGGDFNGDGYPDLLVGGGHAQNAAGLQPGAAAVIYGGPGMAGTTYLGDTSPGSVYFLGPNNADFAGWAVAFAGDANGDGYDDILVGAYSSDAGVVSDAGAAYLVYGGPIATGTYSLAAPPMGGSVFVGAASNDRVGFAVAPAGDVNGDTYADVLIGAPLVDSPGMPDAGRVYLVYGSPLLPPVLSEATLGSNGVVFLPEEPFGAAGFAVGSAGDVTGDGYDDVLVGAPTVLTSGQFTGRAYVVAGGPNLPATIPLASAFARILGPPENALCGRALAGVGDLDGDGFADVLIGAPYYDPANRTDAGSTYLFLGGPALSGTFLLPAGAVTTFVGANDLDRAGQALAGAGDVNGDGIPDLLIGSPYWDAPGGSDEGRAYLVLGQVPMPSYFDFASPDRSTIVLQGTEPAGILGFALAACGDLDGDGFDDIAACAPYTDPGGIFNSGTAAVFYGGPVPTVVASGCAGAASPSPKAWFTGDCPRVGGSKFAVTLSDAAPGSAAAFGIGPPSPPTWPGIPLASFGLPGCMYRVVPILLVGATVGADGTSTLPAPIPNVPALAGFGFDCQWVVFALPGSLASVSDAVRIEIGP